MLWLINMNNYYVSVNIVIFYYYSPHILISTLLSLLLISTYNIGPIRIFILNVRKLSKNG